MQWLLLVLLMSPESDWIASKIMETAGSATGPFRIVWNGGSLPADIEGALLESGLPMTTAMDAARMEITQVTSPAGHIDLRVRLLDASGAVLASEGYRRPSDLPAWRQVWMRVASPVLVTAATGITVYLLYHVRSR
jgi:hypothetical protein